MRSEARREATTLPAASHQGETTLTTMPQVSVSAVKQIDRTLMALKQLSRQVHHLDECRCNYNLTPRQETRLRNLVKDVDGECQRFENGGTQMGISSGQQPVKRLVPGNILASGEVTGYTHRVTVDVFENEDGTREFTGQTVVSHEAHQPITLPENEYVSGRVLEYDHFADMEREVRD